MKKLLSIALLSASFVSLIPAKTTQELAKMNNDFITMAEDFKSKLFDLEGDMHKTKYDLMKKHKLEHAELVKAKKTELAKTKDVDAYLETGLADMIALHKKQMQDWKNFSQAWFDKKRVLGEKAANALATFEGVEETTEETEE